MRAWLEQPHGRRHKAPPPPCTLTTISEGKLANNKGTANHGGKKNKIAARSCSWSR